MSYCDCKMIELKKWSTVFKMKIRFTKSAVIFYQEASSFLLSIPMPGHSVGQSTGKHWLWFGEDTKELYTLRSNLSKNYENKFTWKNVNSNLKPGLSCFVLLTICFLSNSSATFYFEKIVLPQYLCVCACRFCSAIWKVLFFIRDRLILILLDNNNNYNLLYCFPPNNPTRVWLL